MLDNVRNTFRSNRLEYVRLDKDNEEAKAFFTQSLNDAETYAMAMTLLMRPQGRKQVEAVMADYADALLPVLICLPSQNPGGKPVIIGELVIGDDGVQAATAQNRNVGIGLSLLRSHQGQGYGREAMDWALDWCFRHAGMHTVSIGTASYNTRAADLYRKMGFVEEGRRREVIYYDRKWYDSLMFSMTEHEWEALREKQKVG